MDVISILRKKRQDVTGFEVKVDAGRAEDHPKVFTSLAIQYVVHGRNIDPAAVERAMELSKTRYCPAQAMLSQVAPMTMTYAIVEA
jgi:putative redox protein